MQGTAAISNGFGVVVPQVSFDWKHKFDKEQLNGRVSFSDDIQAARFTYETERPDEDFFDFIHTRL